MSTADITVLTVSIPGRTDALARNVESVYRQSVPVARQLICAHQCSTTEQGQIQYTKTKNELLQLVQTEWVAVLNDDDWWMDHHVETMLPILNDADIAYSWDASGQKPRVDVSNWSQERLEKTFYNDNVVDGTCLFRVSMLRRVSGFPTAWVGPGPWEGGHFVNSLARFEDMRLWQLIAPLGARFRCQPVETWTYDTRPGISR